MVCAASTQGHPRTGHASKRSCCSRSVVSGDLADLCLGFYLTYHEPVARHVERVEIRPQFLSLLRSDEGIDENPARLWCIPILADPMVDKPTRPEIGAEPAAPACRMPVSRSSAANSTDQTRICRAADRERLIVQHSNAVDNLSHRSKMPLIAALWRQRAPVLRGPKRVQQYPLHDPNARLGTSRDQSASANAGSGILVTTPSEGMKLQNILILPDASFD
jgi:hypothetical protein